MSSKTRERRRHMKPITTLALANDAIRAAVIEDPYTAQPTVRDFKVLPLPTGAVADGEVINEEAVTELLKTLISKHHYPIENCALAYASRRMVFREATFPEMALEDLKASLPFQAKSLIALPVEESVLDFVPLSREITDKGPQLKGLVVGVLEAGLEKTAQSVEKAGFVLTSIDAAAFSLARVFNESSKNKTEAIVNVGGNITDVIVLENGKPVYMRVVPSGGDDITDAVANTLHIPFESAAEIKRRIGLQNVVGDDRLRQAEEVIRETIAQLIVGVRNTLNFYAKEHPESEISGVILTGAGSLLVGFPSVLASSINKMVRIGDPFGQIKLSQRVNDDNIASHAPDIAAVLGLAIGKRP